jgi:transposase-like protein
VPQSFRLKKPPSKLLYLALQNAAKKWTMPIPNWSRAMNQFAILYDGRLPMLGDNSLTQFS